MRIPENAVGLCAGRHNLPVKGYIYEDVRDVHDFDEIQRIADNFVRDNGGIREITDDYGETVIVGKSLDVVVTGLTALTAAVMAACAWYGVSLTLWHFDRESGEYVPQTFGCWKASERFYK